MAGPARFVSVVGACVLAAAVAVPRPARAADPSPAAASPAAPAPLPAAIAPPVATAPAVVSQRADEPPHPKPHRRYLYESWLFWSVAGALVAGSVLVTYAVTRPGPTPYYGNTTPPIFTFP
jgi:hypothetical protein